MGVMVSTQKAAYVIWGFKEMISSTFFFGGAKMTELTIPICLHYAHTHARTHTAENFRSAQSCALQAAHTVWPGVAVPVLRWLLMQCLAYSGSRPRG